MCDASTTGLLRFADWLVDALGLLDRQPIDVVLNRAPNSASQRTQLVDELRSLVGDRVESIITTPRDRRVERAAWDGAVPARGPFRTSLDRLRLDPVSELAPDIESPFETSERPASAGNDDTIEPGVRP